MSDKKANQIQYYPILDGFSGSWAVSTSRLDIEQYVTYNGTVICFDMEEADARLIASMLNETGFESVRTKEETNE